MRCPGHSRFIPGNRFHVSIISNASWLFYVEVYWQLKRVALFTSCRLKNASPVIIFHNLSCTHCANLCRTSGDCIAALSDLSNVRCRTLLRAENARESQRVDAILNPDSRAWERLLGSLAEDEEKTDVSRNSNKAVLQRDFEHARSEVAVLRDAVLLLPLAFNVLYKDHLKTRKSNRTPWDKPWKAIPPWSMLSPKGCGVEEVRGFSAFNRVLMVFCSPPKACVQVPV